VKNIDFFQIIVKVLPLIRAQDTQGQADERPEVDDAIMTPVMLTQLVDLGMAVVASGNTVVGFGGLNLAVLETTILQPFLLIPGLEVSPPAAATVVVRSVRYHIDEVFFANYRFDDVPEVFCYGIAVGFANDLAGILNRKFDLQIAVPVRVDL
jgi:hypothetical protein